MNEDTKDEDFDFYSYFTRCQMCDIEISPEEDNYNLGLCDECYKLFRL